MKSESDSDARPPLVRFLDSFLQERNIKWMLGIGMLIVFGSSVMLVTSRWDTYTPVWKHLILLTYTVAVYLTGEAGYWRLGLRRTGTVLWSLTVLLLPINFLALHRFGADSSVSLFDGGMHLAVFGLSCLAGSLIVPRVFKHFLRGHQPTFVASYLILCAAQAVVPALPLAWSPAATFLLWGVFAIGTVKVNRHVFWLAEELRYPRIFGFFPIALLGTQFLTLFYLSKLTHQVPLEWLGLAAVLVALPVLLTADAVARVFQQRTGNLVRPLPWSIMLPLYTGLALCAAGLAIAATGMPRPYALVPTAALAGCALAAAARRTGHRGFVWGMLGCLLLAYQFSPVFFQEFARSVCGRGAAAVQEARLPYAFYGLTYLPLLAATTVAAGFALRRGSRTFAQPLKSFSVALGCLLLFAAFGHPKAVFPVGAVLVPLFAAQAIVFRDRRLVALAVTAYVAAAFGLTAFAVTVVGFPGFADMPFVCLGIAAALLLVPGAALDRLSGHLPNGFAADSCRASESGVSPIIFQAASLFVTLAVSGAWLTQQVPHWGGAVPVAGGVLLAALLIAHALRWLKPGLGELALIFASLTGMLQLVVLVHSPTALATLAIVALLSQWALSYVLAARPRLRVSRAFAAPLVHVSLVGLTLGLLCTFAACGVRTLGANFELPWIAALLVVAWSFDAARRLSNRALATFGCLSVLAAIGAALTANLGVETAWRWLPAAWSAAALIAVPWAGRMRARLATMGADEELPPLAAERCERLRAIVLPVWHIALTVLTVVGVTSLMGLTVPARLAGGIAVAGLLLCSIQLPSGELRTAALLLLNWQALSGLLGTFVPEVSFFGAIELSSWRAGCLPLALGAAVSLLANQAFWLGRACTSPNPAPTGEEMLPWDAQINIAHRCLLRLVIAICLASTVRLGPAVLSPLDAPLAAAVFVLLAASELLAACRLGDARRVLLAEDVIGVAIGYFAWFGVIAFGSGWSMYAVLVIAAAAWMVGQASRRHPRTAVMSGPLTKTAMLLPAVTVGIGIFRQLTLAPADWLGMNSLALLFAAGFYFWQGIEQSRKSLIVLSAVITNVALALLWNELAWSDPQFFMIPLGISILALVELLKEEIPAKMHAPLRYAGALTILVSPTFHIVSGSWIHLLTLMVAAVAVTLVSIGLRVRALMYTGTAFLLADLVAMVVRGGIDCPQLLWAGGIVLGAAVLALAAVCERHREELLQRIRLVAAELEAWE